VNRIKGGNLKDRSKWELHTVASTKGGLPNDWVYGLAEGKDGTVWLATEGGLARYVEGKWDNWNHAKGQGAPYELVKDDLAFKNDPSKVSSHHARQKQEMGLTGIDTAYNPNYIVAINADPDGTVWVGTWGGGLAHFDGKNFRNYTTKDGLPGNHVFMLHRTASGDMWVAPNAGLSRMKNEKFETITTNDGLFANTVFSDGHLPRRHDVGRQLRRRLAPGQALTRPPFMHLQPGLPGFFSSPNSGECAQEQHNCSLGVARVVV
jgi:ligand-binding sensor domain-containing protein